MLPLDEINGEDAACGNLGGDSADLGIALSGVAVAYVQERAGHVDRQVYGVAGADIGGVHIAAMKSGRE